MVRWNKSNVEVTTQLRATTTAECMVRLLKQFDTMLVNVRNWYNAIAKENMTMSQELFIRSSMEITDYKGQRCNMTKSQDVATESKDSRIL